MFLAKRIVLISLAIVALAAVGFFLYPGAQSKSFTLPDTPEKLVLAEEQARCAGIFAVFRIALKEENPRYEELSNTFGDAYTRHATMAIKLYFDGEKSKTQIENATEAFRKRLEEMVARKEDLRIVVDEAMSDCQKTELRTLAFIQHALQVHAAEH